MSLMTLMKRFTFGFGCSVRNDSEASGYEPPDVVESDRLCLCGIFGRHSPGPIYLWRTQQSANLSEETVFRYLQHDSAYLMTPKRCNELTAAMNESQMRLHTTALLLLPSSAITKSLRLTL